MAKPVYQAHLCTRYEHVKVGQRADLFNINNPNFYEGRWLITSPVVRIETVGFYIIEIETENSIYEIVP